MLLIKGMFGVAAIVLKNSGVVVAEKNTVRKVSMGLIILFLNFRKPHRHFLVATVWS